MELSDAGYATNGHFVNHCLVSFFERICDPCGINLEPMLYQVGPCTAESGWPVILLLQFCETLLLLQVSVLRVFLQIMSDVSYCRQSGASEVFSFTLGIVRRVLSKLIPKTTEPKVQDGMNMAESGKGCQRLGFSCKILPTNMKSACCPRSAQSHVLKRAMRRPPRLSQLLGNSGRMPRTLQCRRGCPP